VGRDAIWNGGWIGGEGAIGTIGQGEQRPVNLSQQFNPFSFMKGDVASDLLNVGFFCRTGVVFWADLVANLL
jgi:hypothetical protein